MKKIVFILIVLFAGILESNSQIHDPIKWSTSVEKISSVELDLIIKASIKKNWHLYSQSVPKGGPVPTSFLFNSSPYYELIGNVSEGKGDTVNDMVFNMKIKYFENTAIFKQRIKIKTEKSFKIIGEAEYMVCDDNNCLPPTLVDLDFSIESESILIDEATSKNTLQEQTKSTDKNFLVIFILAFISGFTALLTPCVFPMIPLTVSFFTKQSGSKLAGIKNAIFYGVSIVIIYVLLGIIVSAVFGADALNALSTNVVFNLILFILLFVFAVSFLGAFEITLPSSWGTNADKLASKGGVIGIFFMALALAIVSFSCTGPIVGTLLVEAASSGSQIGPIIGMFGFSLAIALPFSLFALFPNWLTSLPKSGEWLNTVKVVLGFLELALAFKFLSNADLVLQLNLIEREVFISIWIAIFGTLTLYLFRKIVLPYDSSIKKISIGRLCLGMIALAFTMYMIPGLWGAPLNLISAFPPPQHYSESPYGVGFSKANNISNIPLEIDKSIPDGARIMAPHNILAFNDYEKGLTYARKIGKPILIDFTGHACVNCRKMEQNVWTDERILQILRNEIVLISLYVDDKRKLKEEDQSDSKLRPGKKLKYIGQRWSEFQTIRYGANAQPFYVLMDHYENNIINPIAYTPDIDTYYNWLKNGVKIFAQNSNNKK